MMNGITIERMADDGLSCERWGFWVNEKHSIVDLVLDDWAEFDRKTKRHKFRAIGSEWADKRPARRYTRTGDTRGYTGSWVAVEDVPVPQDVLYEVRQKWVGMIAIGFWATAEERGPRALVAYPGAGRPA